MVIALWSLGPHLSGQRDIWDYLCVSGIDLFLLEHRFCWRVARTGRRQRGVERWQRWCWGSQRKLWRGIGQSDGARHWRRLRGHRLFAAISLSLLGFIVGSLTDTPPARTVVDTTTV
ncbi:MAG: hypothetical protein H6876_09375 [Hyphomicrobiaceae bacterium]|nr:hypothetical protein [Hyphomicrobiaceae bacterium]